VNNCSASDFRRIRHLRTPRERLGQENELVGTTFDPRKYLKKKK
jgi:hypothetical protein